MDIRQQVEEWLRLLIGLPLVNAGRAADMTWFSFGKEKTVTDTRGNQKNVGEYALHVQCAWRLVKPDGIFVGSSDIYCPPGNVSEERSDFNWDLPGANRYDQRIQEFFRNQESPLFVETIDTDYVGGFKIRFAGNILLEVFPNSSSSVEEWRLFQPGANRPHFSLKGSAIQN